MSRLNGRVHERHNPFDGPLDRLTATAAVATPEVPPPGPTTPPVAPAPGRPGVSPVLSLNSSVRDGGFAEDETPIVAEPWPAPPRPARINVVEESGLP